MLPAATIAVSPADTGIIADATMVELSAMGFGVEPLEYVWTFGDGSNARGPRVSHLYREAGRFTVTLTVTDREGFSGTASVELLARRLDGIWRTRDRGWRYELEQNGTVLSGWLVGNGQVEIPSGLIDVSGSIQQPNRVSFFDRSFVPSGFEGTPDLALDSLSGTATVVGSRQSGFLDRVVEAGAAVRSTGLAGQE